MKKVIQTSNDVGDFIREARDRAGLTRKQVSKKSGYNLMSIYNMEKNKCSMNLSTVLAIATSIGVKVEFSFEDKLNVKIKEVKI